ncbi:LOW QUALITY PROTEIN: coiled-coil domain-containing protein 97 [Drosophila eugracilis]|uniref:LOW QUALITY PROTEIN: coiled-coil domain-containing protein 97 n=1 Tax=Drosophila eugracilis TaxID=29029 RepID=UPI001BDB3DA5|nr:LOW QUALITY PROTEIN: coiled-coil domain-containing protein 97 [Drosophila eugracilis]
MTTGTENEVEGDDESHGKATLQNTEIPLELMDIFKSLAENNKIVFKSQQIDDPEIPVEEKENIAREAFEKNRENFLIRFGGFLNVGQLGSFQNLAVKEPIKPDENLEEMCLLLEDFKRKLSTRSVCIKNRRYHAMQQLLDKGEYFSEHEMMQRAPDLYQELVGQYLTEAEKKARDSYDVRNTSFSGILMHTLEKKQRDELLEETQPNKDDKREVRSEIHTPADFEVPVACRKQWGGFEDDEPIACSTSRNAECSIPANITNISTPEFYNPGERELLRNEFLSMMKERFLSGEDKDFDYSAVDDNTLLDDLKQIEQDEEDAYFEDSDDEEDLGNHNTEDKEASSEDELDIYMRHLNNHHSLQH